MAEKNPVLSTLLALTGDRNTITLHVKIVDFCNGDIETALFLEQMLYWTPRSSNDGWVSKSAAEWYDEIRVSRYAIDKAVKLFHVGDEKKPAGELPFLQTKLKKFNGSPTIHYKLDTEKLAILWSEWLESTNGFAENSKTNLSNSANPPAKNSNSLTESTSKTTTENKDSSLLEKKAKSVRPDGSTKKKATQPPSPDALRMQAFVAAWKKCFQQDLGDWQTINPKTGKPVTSRWISILNWAKWEGETAARVEYANNTFRNDDAWKWHQDKPLSPEFFKTNWPRLTEGYQETSHQSQPRELTRDDVIDLGGI